MIHNLRNSSAIFSLLMLGLLFITSCSSDHNDPGDGDDPTPEAYKYVLMTLSERVVGSKAGFVTAFNDFPEGTLNNIDAKSLQGSNMGGFIAYKNAMYKKYSTEDNSNGIEKMIVQPDGRVVTAAFLPAGQGMPGSGNFVIAEDNLGFYWDMDEPLKIQKFDPEGMARIGSFDMTEAVNERGAEEKEITFRSIGRKFLAVKEGKLYADLNYAKSQGGQMGFWDDYYPDVYIAVIDISTEKWEKTIKVDDTGSISYVNENRMYNFDGNGDLYFITQGRSALGGKSKISRIKSGATDIDPDWELKYADLNPSDEGKFTGVFLHDGLMIVNANTEPLSGGPNGNINTADIWRKYKVDIASRQFSEIQGIPAGRNEGAAESAVFIDGNIYIRLGATSGDINGYFRYDKSTNSAEQVFGVDVGGLVSGFYKLQVEG